MIKSIDFKNFKALRNATLPLGRFTLIVGPNGSGKTSALQALSAAARGSSIQQFVAAGMPDDEKTRAEVTIHWQSPFPEYSKRLSANRRTANGPVFLMNGVEIADNETTRRLNKALEQVRVYALNADAISAAVQLQPNIELGPNGVGLAVVLDQLRDQYPERLDALNTELANWLPEFDRILFATPRDGFRSIVLRQRKGQHRIKAVELSQGTLLALAMLTLAYLPDPPSIIGFEEPDRGIHPRLLRDVKEALYRLSYPENYGEDRAPVQVIATTHSPYLLDLFRDHPEEIVIAQKTDDGATFERLSDQEYCDEVLRDTPLGEAWYTGVLGGVPSSQ